jgi:hypothetical protein
MTQQKAASLTSSLFARKGKASPARLLISEMEGAETDTLDPAETVAATAAAAQAASLAASGAAAGAAGKANGVNGAARRKAKAAEAELPLLAFVEAQDATAEAASAERAGPKENGMVDDDAGAGSAGDLPPAASLLERGAQSLRRTNGRAVDVLPMSAVVSDIEIVIQPEAAADDELDDDETAEAETVSGDANVAAIEDAPQDDEAPLSAAPAEVAVEAEAMAAEDVVMDDAVLVEPAAAAVALAADKAGAAAAKGEASDAAESVAADSGEAAQQAVPATPSVPPSAPPAAQPWVAQRSVGDTAIPATMALRRAAALNPTMPASTGFSRIDSRPEVAPPPAARPALPWRSAAVVVLGAMLGLGGYLVISGKPAQQPAAVADAPAADVPSAQSLSTVQATLDPATTAEVPAAPAAVAEAPATLPEPSFDIIRIEPDGQSIIAGRAQPHSAWILLNNGSPIATVQADANGEWVVLPDASLVPGANAFSLVPKTERGKVAIPAPVSSSPGSSSSSGAAQDSAPAMQQRASEAAVPQGAPAPAEAGPDVALPKPKPEASIPAAKPAVPPVAFRVSPDGDYEVQVASVREVADAERERGRLAASFPKLLGELDLRVQEASVEGAGTFFRVRSGAIADLGVARELCRQLEAAGQGCLVVRRAAAPEAPNVEAVAEQATEPAADAGSAAQQQAERPQ